MYHNGGNVLVKSVNPGSYFGWQLCILALWVYRVYKNLDDELVFWPVDNRLDSRLTVESHINCNYYLDTHQAVVIPLFLPLSV